MLPADQLERLGGDGLPDTSFGPNGTGIVGPPKLGGTALGEYRLEKILVLEDGTIETAGTASIGGSEKVAFTHYTASGEQDALATAAASGNGPFDMAQQPVSHDLVAVSGGDEVFRLNGSHELDSGFGSGGVETYTGWEFRSVAISAEDEIVAGGTDPGTGSPGVVAFDGSTGAPENGFGESFPAGTDMAFGQSTASNAHLIAVRRDPGSGAYIAVAETSAVLAFEILGPTGHVNEKWASKGVRQLAASAPEQAGELEVSPEGAYIFAGSTRSGFATRPLLAGVFGSGSADTEISASGIYQPGVDGAYTNLAFTSDGRYVLGGFQEDQFPTSGANSFVERLVGESGATPPTLGSLKVALANPAHTPQTAWYLELRQGAPAPTAADWSEATQHTNPSGEATIPVLPNDVVYFNRTAQPTSGGEPEGVTGQAYTVPGTVPTGTQAVALAGAGAPYNPDLSGPEEWMIGQINALRAAHGAPALHISTILNSAASIQARNEALGGGFPYSFVGVVNQDQGWPGDTETELFALADAPYTDPTRVLTHWNGSPSDPESPGIFSVLSNPSFHLVGVADGDGAWIIEVAGGCPVEHACQETEDVGNIAAWSPPPPAGSPAPTPTGGGGTSTAAATTSTTTSAGGSTGGSAGGCCASASQLNALLPGLLTDVVRDLGGKLRSLARPLKLSARAGMHLAVSVTSGGPAAARAKHRVTVIASGSATIGASGRATLHLTLTRPGKALVARSRKAVLIINLVLGGASAQHAAGHRTVTLKR